MFERYLVLIQLTISRHFSRIPRLLTSWHFIIDISRCSKRNLLTATAAPLLTTLACIAMLNVDFFPEKPTPIPTDISAANALSSNFLRKTQQEDDIYNLDDDDNENNHNNDNDNEFQLPFVDSDAPFASPASETIASFVDVINRWGHSVSLPMPVDTSNIWTDNHFGPYKCYEQYVGERSKRAGRENEKTRSEETSVVASSLRSSFVRSACRYRSYI